MRSLAWLLNATFATDDLARVRVSRETGIGRARLGELFDGAVPLTEELILLGGAGVPLEPCREWRALERQEPRSTGDQGS